MQIKDNFKIGTGSVYTKSYRSNLVIAENPARIIKEFRAVTFYKN